MGGADSSGSEYSQDEYGGTRPVQAGRGGNTHCPCFEHDAWQTVTDPRWTVIGIGKARDDRWVVQFVAVPPNAAKKPAPEVQVKRGRTRHRLDEPAREHPHLKQVKAVRSDKSVRGSIGEEREVGAEEGDCAACQRCQQRAGA
jgi:hypothetical protein